jgi:hypothetical protein
MRIEGSILGREPYCCTVIGQDRSLLSRQMVPRMSRLPARLLTPHALPRSSCWKNRRLSFRDSGRDQVRVDNHTQWKRVARRTFVVSLSSPLACVDTLSEWNLLCRRLRPFLAHRYRARRTAAPTSHLGRLSGRATMPRQRLKPWSLQVVGA